MAFASSLLCSLPLCCCCCCYLSFVVAGLFFTIDTDAGRRTGLDDCSFCVDGDTIATLFYFSILVYSFSLNFRCFERCALSICASGQVVSFFLYIERTHAGTKPLNRRQ